jgi:predicted secreted hydrolase
MRSIFFTIVIVTLFAVPALAAPPVAANLVSVGFPQDAAPHDSSATIEWWYFNTFLKTETGKNYAVVGAFFRTGLGSTRKGHLLIYSLANLDDKRVITTASIMDATNITILRALLALAALQHPDDQGTLKLLATLQKDQLPEPCRLTADPTRVVNTPRFSIELGGNAFAQVTDDGRTWRADLKDPAFALSLTLSQPTRPEMRVGGDGMTGLARPDDMFYVSLTRTQTTGELLIGGNREKVAGTGWIDRQWGSSWVVVGNGWDWFGVQLTNGEDLVVYRIKDTKSGKVLRAEATLLRADGSLVVDKDVSFTPIGKWFDRQSGIAFPRSFMVAMQNIGYELKFTPVFDEQTIPMLGTAFWEGVVNVSGNARDGTPLAGRGYRELVGYTPTSASKTQTANPR